LHFVEYNVATTLALHMDQRLDSDAYFEVRYPTGGIAYAATAVTLDGVDTTLAGAAAAGASTLLLSSGDSVAVGRRYALGGHESDGGETVTVRGVSGATVTLVRPLRYAAASGATFKGLRIACALPALTKIGRHYRLEVHHDPDDEQPVRHIPFDVTRYVPSSALVLEDVRSVDPIFAKRMGAGIWWPDLKEEAWQLILRRIAATKDPGSMVGVVELTQVHSYAVRMLVAETAGDEHEKYRDDLRTRFQQELEATLAAGAFDDDQDQSPESHEQWARSITINRG
jgi:hypothetical protein